MKIGLLQVSLQVPNSGSLKHKRKYLQSIKTQIRNKFNVSVAETGSHDLWQKIELAAVMVATDSAHIDRVFEEVLKLIEKQPEVEILEDYRELL